MFIFIKGNFSGLQLQASTEYGVKTCLFPGMHLIEVLYDDAPVPKSPFRVSVVEGCDPTRVRAYGPGLEGGVTNKPNCFTVETRYQLNSETTK